jgi:hypothetical protein
VSKNSKFNRKLHKMKGRKMAEVVKIKPALAKWFAKRYANGTLHDPTYRRHGKWFAKFFVDTWSCKQDEVSDEEVSDDEVSDGEVSDDESSDDEVSDDESSDDEVSDDESSDDESSDGESSDGESSDDESSGAGSDKNRLVFTVGNWYERHWNPEEGWRSFQIIENPYQWKEAGCVSVWARVRFDNGECKDLELDCHKHAYRS